MALSPKPYEDASEPKVCSKSFPFVLVLEVLDVKVRSESEEEREMRLVVDSDGVGGGGTAPERLLVRLRRRNFGREKVGAEGVGDGDIPVNPYVLERSPKAAE